MDYDAVLGQVLELLQHEKRLSYRVLKRRLQLDDDTLEDLKEDLIYAKQLAVDEERRVLVWAVGAEQTPASIQVPSTVQTVLTARIDRLPPGEKALLHTAAVIGHEVPLALLQAVAEGPEGSLRLGPTHLQGAEFLYETRLFPEIEYTFKHALTQQVAYETLIQERRAHAGARSNTPGTHEPGICSPPARRDCGAARSP